ncbi:MAG: lspA [Chloroflexi bacterium]|jgi:signal peptidase II|nr:lspA [Chloroflexota bacterium]
MQTETGEHDVTALIIKQPLAQERRRLGYYWPLAVALVVIIIDQLVKKWTEDTLGPLGSGKSIELLDGQFRLIYIVNKGASFGFLNNADVAWIFALLALVVSIGLVAWYARSGTRNRWLQLGLGLVLGGIVGNLIDRLFRGGGVTDMFTMPSVGIFKVFNVADSGITVGVVIIIATILLQGWTAGKNIKEPKG